MAVTTPSDVRTIHSHVSRGSWLAPSSYLIFFFFSTPHHPTHSVVSWDRYSCESSAFFIFSPDWCSLRKCLILQHRHEISFGWTFCLCIDWNFLFPAVGACLVPFFIFLVLLSGYKQRKEDEEGQARICTSRNCRWRTSSMQQAGPFRRHSYFDEIKEKKNQFWFWFKDSAGIAQNAHSIVLIDIHGRKEKCWARSLDFFCSAPPLLTLASSW